MNSEISFESRITVPAATLVQVSENEAVLLNLATVNYYSLDDVGTRFWECLQATSSIATACERLAQEYDVSVEAIRDDMQRFLKKLADRGLVDLARERRGQ